MFEVLAQNNIIGANLKKSLMEMAGFRNFLVHRYSQIDNERVFEIVKSNLSDIGEFVKAIEKFLEKEEKP